MKRSRKHPSRKFREFSKVDSEKLGSNYCKLFANALYDFKEDRNMPIGCTMMLLWGYEYEFFTTRYAAQRSGYQESYIKLVIMPTLIEYGLVNTMYSRNNEGITQEQLAMRNIETSSYRNRYSLTRLGRLHVQEFYRKLEGREAIKRKDYWVVGGQPVKPSR